MEGPSYLEILHPSFGFRNQGTPSKCSGIGEDPNQMCISLFLDTGISYHDRGDQLLGSSVQTLGPNTYVLQKIVTGTFLKGPMYYHRIHVTTVFVPLPNTFATVSPRALPPSGGSSKHWLGAEIAESTVAFPLMWVTSVLTHPVHSVFISVAMMKYSN